MNYIILCLYNKVLSKFNQIYIAYYLSRTLILSFFSGKELNLTNIETGLIQNGFDVEHAYKLGEQLIVPPQTIQTVVKSNGGLDWDKILTEIIIYWLNNGLDLSWESLANALSRCDYDRIATVILHNMKATQTGPEQPSPMEVVVSKEQEGK